MAARVKRRDIGALVLLIALELGLLCLLGATFRFDGGDRELVTRGAARVAALTYFWPALGPEPLACEPAEPVPAPKPIEPARKTAPKPAPAPVVEAVPDVAPAAPVAAAPAMALPRSPEPTLEVDSPDDVVDPCGGDLCCAAATTALPARNAGHAGPPEPASDESDNPDRMVLTWPASRRDDVVYRLFALPGRRFVGSSGENWYVHLRKPSDPDCYKIQACDRSGAVADGPLTICIKRRRTWG